MLRELFDLSGRVAVISGGSRGLGLQIAEALGEFGATVALVARKEDELAAAVDHLSKQNIRAAPIVADLADPAAAEMVAAGALALADRIDILVNNAGAAWGAPAERHPLSAWRKVIDLNLTGTFLLTQAVGRAAMLPASAGRIINIASIEGMRGRPPGMPGTIAYATSKGGMISFTRSLAAEWGPRGITVNAIAPGFFPSKMTRGTLDRFGAEIVARTPLGRLGGPHDLKGAALLFASDAGAHITGQVLAVDGGATAV
ncbi:MAG TPA: SDR family oxidoreductase [Acetobacteraceae bacterium]|nr:SDR family oxidoreductase [Acetobacteraceae bacterium]